MWKLIWKDSFHLNKTNNILKTYFPIYILFFNNFIYIIKDTSWYDIVFVIYLIVMLLGLAIFPISLARGLYLCPLTDYERIKYLKSACYLRIITMMSLLGIVLILMSFFIDTNNSFILVRYVYAGFFSLSGIALSVHDGNGGIQNPQDANNAKVKDENDRLKTHSTILSLIIFILSVIGIYLPMFIKSDKVLNLMKWLYNLPAITISITLLMIYIVKYFNKSLSIKANCEAFTYLPKKKVGVFGGD